MSRVNVENRHGTIWHPPSQFAIKAITQNGVNQGRAYWFIYEGSNRVWIAWASDPVGVKQEPEDAESDAGDGGE